MNEKGFVKLTIGFAAMLQVKPKGWMADAAGANSLSVKRAFPWVTAEFYNECQLHFGMDVKRLGNLLQKENRAEHYELWRAWRESDTPTELEFRTSTIVRFWEIQAPGNDHRVQGFIAFHLRHAGYIVDAFRPEESITDKSKRPIVNLSEIVHAAWKKMHGYGKSLPLAVEFDITILVNQVVQGELESNAGEHKGKGPDLREGIRRMFHREQCKESLKEILQTAAAVGFHTTEA